MALLFYSLALNAQLPQGKLFLTAFPDPGAEMGQLGYMSYPDEQFHFMDSVNAFSLYLQDGKLYVAGEDLLIYDTKDDQLLNTLPDMNALLVRVWKGYLLVATSDAPHFRAYDMQDQFNLAWTIDNAILPAQLTDMTFVGDTLILNNYYHTLIYDLKPTRYHWDLSGSR